MNTCFPVIDTRLRTVDICAAGADVRVPVADSRFTISRLQREWNRLAVHRASVLRARGWMIDDHLGTIESLEELLDALGQPRRSSSSPSRSAALTMAVEDRRMARLVTIARTDDLAARVALQRMLPGLSSVARRRAVGFADELALGDELLGVAWTVIREFDPSRPTRSLTSRLVDDCAHRVFRAPARVERRSQKCVVDPVVWGADEQWIDPADELDAVLREAQSMGVDDDDIAFLRSLVSTSCVDIARRLAVTERTVRNRRDVVLHRVRRAVLATAA